jgi:hypothetical protein
MITSSPKVFVGVYDDAKTTVAAQAVGNVFLAAYDGVVITTANEASYVGKAFRIGHVEGQDVITNPSTGAPTTINRVRYGDIIDPLKLKNADDLKSAAYADIKYVAPVQQVSTVDLTNVGIYPYYRYVIRIQYQDLNEIGAQPALYTRSYEVFGEDVSSVDTLGAAFVKVINKVNDRRITASYNTTTKLLTLTALERNDDPDLWTPNKYKQVIFNTSMYVTNLRDSILYNNYYENSGAVINIATKPVRGSGFWKMVRDEERESLAWRGYTNQLADFMPIPTLYTTIGGQYDTVTIDFESMYKSADNQYSKTTPLVEKVYLTTAADNADFLEVVQTVLGLA